MNRLSFIKRLGLSLLVAPFAARPALATPREDSLTLPPRQRVVGPWKERRYSSARFVADPSRIVCWNGEDLDDVFETDLVSPSYATIDGRRVEVTCVIARVEKHEPVISIWPNMDLSSLLNPPMTLKWREVTYTS